MGVLAEEHRAVAALRVLSILPGACLMAFAVSFALTAWSTPSLRFMVILCMMMLGEGIRIVRSGVTGRGETFTLARRRLSRLKSDISRYHGE